MTLQNHAGPAHCRHSNGESRLQLQNQQQLVNSSNFQPIRAADTKLVWAHTPTEIITSLKISVSE